MITAADMDVLRALARYYVLTCGQIQQVCFAGHTSSRATRRHLGKLRHDGYIERHSVVAMLPDGSGAAPVYYATNRGAELLTTWFEDDSYQRLNTKTPRADRLTHWVALNNTRLIVEQALAQQQPVRLCGWVSEWQTIHSTNSAEEQFVLHTQLSESPPLSCSPDAAFLLECRGHRRVYYVEQDLGTSSPHQVAARKTKGYAELATRNGHLRHFPAATVPTFRVLMLTTSAYRVRAIAREVSERPRPDLWLFIDQRELTPESFLFQPITFDSQGQPGPLVQQDDAPTVILPPSSDSIPAHVSQAAAGGPP